MKPHDITKLCADSLRSYFNDEYGIKLKSGHAHELVAAFFGFKSRIAMLTEKGDVISEWDYGEFVLTAPPISLIDHRLRQLLELPPDLSSRHVMAETVYAVLVGQLYLHRHLRKLFRSGPPPIKWQMRVNIEHSVNEAMLTVDVGQPAGSNERLRDSRYVIHLPRSAGDIGYGMPRVDEVRYSGIARKYSDEELNKMYPPPPNVFPRTP